MIDDGRLSIVVGGMMKKLSYFLFGIAFCTSLYGLLSKKIFIRNNTPFIMRIRWQYEGDYFRRTIEPGQERSVADLRLFKGFKEVHAESVKVGQEWGKNPDNGKPLVITAKMIDDKNECWGINPDVYYKKIGQNVVPKEGAARTYILTVVPEKNKDDNNNWWPRFVLKPM